MAIGINHFIILMLRAIKYLVTINHTYSEFKLGIIIKLLGSTVSIRLASICLK